MYIYMCSYAYIITHTHTFKFWHGFFKSPPAILSSASLYYPSPNLSLHITFLFPHHISPDLLSTSFKTFFPLSTNCPFLFLGFYRYSKLNTQIYRFKSKIYIWMRICNVCFSWSRLPCSRYHFLANLFSWKQSTIITFTCKWMERLLCILIFIHVCW